MSDRMYKVGTVAQIAKVTIRALHHYDEIGLLTPSGRSGAGYRLYTHADIERLQQIRFHRELGMPLDRIRDILDAPSFESRAALLEHRKHLTTRLHETEALVATIDRMLDTHQGGKTMNAKDMFDGFEPDQYEPEAKAAWGNTPSWKEAQRRTKSYGPEQWSTIKAEEKAIVQSLAANQAAGDATDSDVAMESAEAHRLHLDRWYYPCSPQMHAGLAEMYTSDPRFAKHFNDYGDGLAAYVAEAIRANAARA